MKSEETIVELFGKMPYKPLVEEIKDYAIFHLDTEGIILSWNQGAEMIFGFSKDEIIGQHSTNLFTPEDRAQNRPGQELKTAKETGRAEDTRWHLRKDGSRFFAQGVTTALRDETGKLLGYAKIARDDTGRKEMEEALLESEEKYRIVAETATDAIISINEQSIILFINRAAIRIFGYQIEQMIGQSLTMLMPEYLRHLHRAGQERYIKTGKKHLNWEHIEVPALHKDGHEFPLELSFGEFSKNNKHIFIGIARDITERKKAEEEREQLLRSEQAAREEAERANRLKDEFLATLSHELRTPLNAILGWSQVLQYNNLDEAGIKRATATIERNARAQNQLIDDILDVSRIITGKLRLDVRAVDLSNVISEAADAARPAAEAKNIGLQTLIDPQATQISGDPDRLQQVVWNLLSNAIKFTPRDGRVQLRLERVNSHIEIVVSDTGAGIEPEFLPFVFERFRQSDGSMTRRHGGLGLGLAIVRQLVELHGGAVSVESKGAGQGATFIVSLPFLPVRLDPEDAVPRVHPTAQNGSVLDCPPELSGLRVLLVDDEADSRELLNFVLESCGAQISTASSAAEAIELIKRERFDVIISDIGMPEEDGFLLIRKIRSFPKEQGGNIPALALTAYARAEDRVQALRSGFHMHIAKPVESVELIAAVANLAGRMRKLNESEEG